jgi:hypothetical protein
VTRANLWRIGILFAFIAIVGSLAVSRPDVLADNRFLNDFMGPDLIAVLVVVLTITFASVANVHLSISRLIARAPDRAAAENAADGARGEINSNAWAIFWALMVALIALFLNGEFPDDKLVDALTSAVCMTVVLLNGLVMHDIYRSIFMLVASERVGKADGEGPNYTS